jgi:EpsI family protein
MRHVPVRLAGNVIQLPGRTLFVTEACSGLRSLTVRLYEYPESSRGAGFTLYVGYYDRQTQGRTIHSPKNCLPGSGWEPLASRAATVATAAGAVTANRYLLQNGRQHALVLYWYQGRGRVAWNEYGVKWDLLRDAALRRRSDEALVRIVVPVQDTEADAARLAREIAAAIVPAVARALPP